MSSVTITIGANKFEAVDVEINAEFNATVDKFLRMVGPSPTQDDVDKLAAELDQESQDTARAVAENTDPTGG